VSVDVAEAGYGVYRPTPSAMRSNGRRSELRVLRVRDHDAKSPTVRLPIATTLGWKLRSRLTANGRGRARRIADSLLSWIGSINGAVPPTRRVAITFDDGPDSTVTPEVLDLLRDRGVHGTFFLLTDRASCHPDLVRRMVVEGHEIALHADRHERFTEISILELRRRLSAAREALRVMSHQRVRFLRPPFGSQSIATYLVARICGLDVVVWGPHAEDWLQGSPEVVAARGLENLKGGDVLLLHDGLVPPAGQVTPTFDRVRAFALILDGMTARGLSPTTVGELIASGSTRRTAWFRP
jgi:peptidoglycan/xylan/chitin deacetylase (PgdA/CDA1 family)